MYFPFIYGRQSELLAVRSLTRDARSLAPLVPVVEPVNSDVAPLAKCFEACEGRELPIALIFNPDKHQLATRAAAAAWRKNALSLIEKYASVIPTYRCHSATTQENIEAFFKVFPERETAITYSSSGLSDEETKALSTRPTVRFHIVLNGKITGIQRAMMPKAKYVAIQDNFNKLDRNADYGGRELFTDRHKTFSSSGIGFGDYAAIGAAFQASGSTPAAVAIHAIYENSATKDIWIEHFVSDDKDKSIGDVASKFLQASKKLVNASKKRPNEFGRNFGLDAYDAHLKASTFPGLPKNKEFQIAHHVCLMLDVLSGALK